MNINRIELCFCFHEMPYHAVNSKLHLRRCVAKIMIFPNTCIFARQYLLNVLNSYPCSTMFDTLSCQYVIF